MNTKAPDQTPDHDDENLFDPVKADRLNERTKERILEKYGPLSEPADILYHGLDQINSAAGRARVEQAIRVVDGEYEEPINVHDVSPEDAEIIRDYVELLTASGVDPQNVGKHLMIQRVLIERIDHPDLPSITDSSQN